MSTQQRELGLEAGSQDSGPVECLGLTFKSDAERRAHFTALLREKLQDPEFRKHPGFPTADDEAILRMSDPPYYTACPNPFLAEYVRCYGDSSRPGRGREPFASDVSEGKNHAVYRAHSYHTKVPHTAIRRYIEHYTEPGDLVLDVFCGTGMTGVAAQSAKGGPRRAILIDLSPAATEIAASYNLAFDAAEFRRQSREILDQVRSELGDLSSQNFQTRVVRH